MSKEELDKANREALASIEKSARELAELEGVDISDIVKPEPCKCGALICDEEDSLNWASKVINRVAAAHKSSKRN
jgi:hypothetical protein